MVGEAAATGAPILVFEPSGGHPKLDAFLAGLKGTGVVHPFRGRLEARRYDPLNSTPDDCARRSPTDLPAIAAPSGLPEPVPAPETP